jgi:hypothetical protein
MNTFQLGVFVVTNLININQQEKTYKTNRQMIGTENNANFRFVISIFI